MRQAMLKMLELDDWSIRRISGFGSMLGQAPSRRNNFVPS